jgi:hypothetical protein
MILPPAGRRERRLAIAALLVHAACAGDGPAPAPLVMFDSAGIRIVESRAPTWQAGEAWAVAPEPEIVIGQAQGEQPYLLSGVVGAVRLSDGRVLIADGGSSELRLFDSTGRFLRQLGGPGDDPGDFANLASIHLLRGDSVAAWDGLRHRLTIFAAGESVAREWNVADASVSVPPVIGVFDDGSLLTSTARGGTTGAPVEEYRDTTLWVRIRAGTTRTDVIGRLPGAEQVMVTSASSTESYQVLFGRASLAATASDRWFAAENGTYEIRVSSPAGELAAILRRRTEPRLVTATILAAQREAISRDREATEAAIRTFTEARGGTYAAVSSLRAEDVPHRGSIPYFDRLLADRAGNLWVRNYLVTGETRQIWSVFDRPGRWLGDVETPTAVDVLSIGDDYLLGHGRDAAGVESVRLHRLSRPPAAPDPS